MKKNEFFNIPNLLSLSRIPCGFIFLILFLIVQKGNRSDELNLILNLTSLLIFTLAIITDALDGYLARRLGIVTDIGKHLDPFADSLFFIIIFSTFTISGFMHPILLILILIREGFMHVFLRPYVKKRGKSLPASIFGKVKTFCQCLFSLILLFLFIMKDLLLLNAKNIIWLNCLISIIAPTFFCIIAFLSITSLIIYLINLPKILQN